MNQSNGYSSEVRGWLIADGICHDLAQVGPRQCELQSSARISATLAQVIVEIDGERHSREVQIRKTYGPSRLVNFEPVDETCSLADDQK